MQGSSRSISARYCAADTDRFTALNSAFWQAGVFLYVPRGVRIEQPIRVLRHLPEAGLAYVSRTLIVAEEGSHVGFVEEMDSRDFDRPTFSSSGVTK